MSQYRPDKLDDLAAYELVGDADIMLKFRDSEDGVRGKIQVTRIVMLTVAGFNSEEQRERRQAVAKLLSRLIPQTQQEVASPRLASAPQPGQGQGEEEGGAATPAEPFTPKPRSPHLFREPVPELVVEEEEFLRRAAGPHKRDDTVDGDE